MDDLLHEASGPNALQTRAPYRPVQYLGSKLRALSTIESIARQIVGPGGSVADLFSGSTVVAQLFARTGYDVTAVDTQKYSGVFATALLGVGRKIGESCASIIPLIELHEDHLAQKWGEWADHLKREQEALAAQDASSLVRQAARLPLIWRMRDDPRYTLVSSTANAAVHAQGPLVTELYSGSYFGVRQALAIDTLRHQANELLVCGRISKWQYAALLTAIMAAASAAVHSAGKHFAQPLGAGSSKNFTFLEKRLLQDRSVSICKQVVAALEQIDISAAAYGANNRVFVGTAEDYIDLSGSAHDLYYLDPPYTAQQYSRFYHILEVITDYTYPHLVQGGAVSGGLYPSDRYKSAFSSKTKALPAMRQIVETASRQGSALLVSYSNSSPLSKGNSRMITYEGLLATCVNAYGKANVREVEMSHRYRQFNSASRSTVSREDPEVLLACTPR
jgi:adenine-specific DNA-methyltransferase